MYDEETWSILRDPYARRAYQPLTKAETTSLCVRCAGRRRHWQRFSGGIAD